MKWQSAKPLANHVAQTEVKTIVLLSLTEVGLGSILHAFSIPFGGHFLSLNQGLLLTQAAKRLQTDRIPCAKSCNSISLVSGLLKSLSPAGKKLTPMLAITVQGLLYSGGIIILGTNRAGMILGCLLLSLWGFIQPIGLAWLLVGGSFFSGLDSLWNQTFGLLGLNREWAFILLIACIGFKFILAILSVLFSERLSKKWGQKLNHQGTKVFETKAKVISPAKGALRDLVSPLFAFSILISVSFAYFNGSNASALLWSGLRPLVLGFAIFYTIRIIPIETVRATIEKLSPTLADRLARAQEVLNRKDQ